MAVLTNSVYAHQANFTLLVFACAAPSQEGVTLSKAAQVLDKIDLVSRTKGFVG